MKTLTSPRSVRLTLAYDGSEFFGWQSQPGRRTVQSVLEDAIRSVTGESLRVVAAGRTDTGVHALAQAVSLTTSTHLDNRTLLKAINANLPPDISLLEMIDVPLEFNAIDQSHGKRYRYWIQDGPVRDVFLRQYAWRVWQVLDVTAMHQAAQTLRGCHDFRSFQNEGSPRVSTVRTVRDFTVGRRCTGTSDLVWIEIEADGFLYNMVRNLVGTLVDVGKRKQPIGWPAEVLAAHDRTQAGMRAPAHGLCLVKVYY